MSIHIVCNNCNSSYDLKDELAWKKAKCPKCGNIIEIPENEDVIEIIEELNPNEEIKKEIPINEKPSNNEECRVIKPKIIKSLLFLSSWLPMLILSLVSIILFLFIIPVLNENTIFSMFILLFAVIIIFLIIAYIKYWFSKRALEKIDYKFYDNKIEYYDWFLVKNRKTIKISRITDVSQKRGIIERMFWLGTVNISTAGSIWYEISMSYLENSDDVYDFIDNLVSQYENNKNSWIVNNKNIASENNVSEKIENKSKNLDGNAKVIKPKIIKSLLILNAINTTLWWLFFIAIFAWEFLIMLNFIFIIILILIFISISYIFSKIQLQKISYKFYDNKIEYYDWFLVKNKKTIKINRITDVSQKRGIVERIFWLGTIGLSTAGSHWNQINMSYLENSDDVYNFIDNIVSANES